MNRFLVLIAVCVAGCQLTTLNDNAQNGSTLVVTDQPTAADIWIALARAIDAKTLTTTTQLTRAIALLARNGELSATDIASFDARFPDFTKTDRELGSDDAIAIRGLK